MTLVASTVPTTIRHQSNHHIIIIKIRSYQRFIRIKYKMSCCLTFKIIWNGRKLFLQKTISLFKVTKINLSHQWVAEYLKETNQWICVHHLVGLKMALFICNMANLACKICTVANKSVQDTAVVLDQQCIWRLNKLAHQKNHHGGDETTIKRKYNIIILLIWILNNNYKF